MPLKVTFGLIFRCSLSIAWFFLILHQGKAAELKHNAEVAAHQIQEKSEEIAHKVAEASKDFAHQAQEKSKEWAHQAQETSKELAHQVQGICFAVNWFFFLQDRLDFDRKNEWNYCSD